MHVCVCTSIAVTIPDSLTEVNAKLVDVLAMLLALQLSLPDSLIQVYMLNWQVLAMLLQASSTQMFDLCRHCCNVCMYCLLAVYLVLTKLGLILVQTLLQECAQRCSVHFGGVLVIGSQVQHSFLECCVCSLVHDGISYVMC